MRTTKIFNFLLLILLVVYFGFLIARLVIERLPIDPNRIIILFLTLSIIFKSSSFLIVYFIKNKDKKIVPSYKLGKIKQIVSFFLEKVQLVEDFVQVDFIRQFLGNKKYCAKFFFSSMRFYEKLVKKKIAYIFLVYLFIISRILINFCLAVEIFVNNQLFFTFYLLAFNFLIFRLVDLWFFIIKNYFSLLGNMTLATYLPEFFLDEKALNFFYYNPIIRTLFFLGTPELQNKRMMIFCWNLFEEVFYFYRIRNSVESLQGELKIIKKAFLKVKIICYSCILSLLNFPEFIFLDLLRVFTLFLLVFIIFLIFLNYLKEDIAFRKEYLSFDVLMNILMNNTFLNVNSKLVVTKTMLLLQYDFLVPEDLPVFVNNLDFDSWWSQRKILLQPNNPYYVLTSEQKVVWENVVKELYHFYKNESAAGPILKKKFTIDID